MAENVNKADTPSILPTIAASLHWAYQQLAPDSDAKRDSELLLMQALNCTRCELITQAKTPLTASQHHRFQHAVLLRQQGYPTAYLLGEWASFALTLQVSPDTLIPRPETDVLIQTCLDKLAPFMPLRIADLGAGSGAIALNLAHARAKWQIMATDISTAALQVASANARQHKLHNVAFVVSDWCQALAEEQCDAIVSNPPYIDATDPHLTALSHEPYLALVAEDNGLAAIKQIIQQAPFCLKAQGWLMLEHGYQQGEAVRSLLAQADFEHIETIADLAGRPRVTIARKSAV